MNIRNMRKLFFVLVGAMISCAISAQVLTEGESAFVYYSPKTAISLDFTYTVETQERGIYAEFAEDLLGATEAIESNETNCVLKEVKISTSTATDYSRPHKVDIESGFPMLLSINEKGLLTGYNVAAEGKKGAQQQREVSARSAEKSRINSIKIAPYPEEVLKTGSLREQAQEVAKQIFRIRETRMYLLNGEVEHAPADGKSMELVLNELDKQERALTELFVGKRHCKKAHKMVRLEPTDEGHLLFFSDENGFTEGDNIDADTIEIRMTCRAQNAAPADPKAKKKGGELSQIVYNIPGQCEVNVLYKGRQLANREVPVAQLGIDVALPKSLFTGKELPKIVFSEKTGNIVSISK